MSLRTMLGPDADRVRAHVDALLDSEDALIVLMDGSRAISFAHGFAASPSQLELVALQIERAVRSIAGPPVDITRNRNCGEEGDDDNEPGRGSRPGRNPGRCAA